MSFGCRSLSVPNSAPRRLPDATAPHRQREGNGYAEQGRGDAPRAAIYCRLSEEDADKADPGQDSRSIQNQKSMLVRYAVEQGWQIYNIYSDDDYTGSDRERPQFNRLLEDARRGCFDIVLCKSQSASPARWSWWKNTSTACSWNGAYALWAMPTTPTPQIRGNKKARQINGLVNEWYLEDMSQNIRTVLDAKRRQGEFVGSFASYGYRKDPQDKHRLLVDEPAAAVVRRIYALYLSGWGASRIAAQLNGNRCRIQAHTKSRTTRLSTGAAPPRWQSFGAIPRCWAS